MRVLITGGRGQLGRALVAAFPEQAVWSGGRDELDIGNREAVEGLIREIQPRVVINAAAYNDVDGAESALEEALRVNAAGPAHLAQACRDSRALLVHVSTDYVFDGSEKHPYTEEHCPRPKNAYGVSKLAGELLVAALGGPHLIVRTSGLFGAGGSRVKGGSFVDRIVTRAREGRPLRVVADQVFSPTYAPDLAVAIRALIEGEARGLVHVTNAGSCSWRDMAAAALAELGLRVSVEGIRSSELKAAAARPEWSVLSSERYRSLGLPTLRPWREALSEFLSS
jgi:dTDP-4-dehydrorhamnose reductase